MSNMSKFNFQMSNESKFNFQMSKGIERARERERRREKMSVADNVKSKWVT